MKLLELWKRSSSEQFTAFAFTSIFKTVTTIFFQCSANNFHFQAKKQKVDHIHNLKTKADSLRICFIIYLRKLHEILTSLALTLHTVKVYRRQTLDKIVIIRVNTSVRPWETFFKTTHSFVKSHCLESSLLESWNTVRFPVTILTITCSDKREPPDFTTQSRIN